MQNCRKTLTEKALRIECEKTPENEAKIRARYQNIPKMAARCLLAMIEGVDKFAQAVIEHNTHHMGFFCKIEGRRKNSRFGFFRYNIQAENKGKIAVYQHGDGYDRDGYDPEEIFQIKQDSVPGDKHGFIEPTLKNVKYALTVLESSYKNILQNKSGSPKISSSEEEAIDLGSYGGEWLALVNEKVIAHGKDLSSVMAKTKKITKRVVFLKAPEDEVTVV